MTDTTRLRALRSMIDVTDESIVMLLKHRQDLVMEINAAKEGGPIFDAEREAAVFEKVLASARRHGVDETTVGQVWRTIFSASRAFQHRLRKKALDNE